MIDLKLTEIFSILGVGIFVVISIAYFYFLIPRLFNIRRHNKDAFTGWVKTALNGNYKDTAYAIVSALLVYSAGILTQDITDHMTDSERNFNPLISFVNEIELLDNEGELRKAVLIVNEKKLTGLGREMFGNARKILKTDPAENLPFFDDGTQPVKYWEANGDSVYQQKKDLTSFVNRLYYTSKNWCYMESEPTQKELDDIQERIDFSRSICIISFFAILGILLMYLSYYVNELMKKKTSRFKVIIHRFNKRVVARKVFNPARAILILLVILYVAKICYSAAEKNFNERAMGYYVSQMKFNKTENSK